VRWFVRYKLGHIFGNRDFWKIYPVINYTDRWQKIAVILLCVIFISVVMKTHHKVNFTIKCIVNTSFRTIKNSALNNVSSKIERAHSSDPINFKRNSISFKSQNVYSRRWTYDGHQFGGWIGHTTDHHSSTIGRSHTDRGQWPHRSGVCVHSRSRIAEYVRASAGNCGATVQIMYIWTRRGGALVVLGHAQIACREKKGQWSS
jgi:hypothetical protein